MQERKDELVYAAHHYGVTTMAQLSPNILPELESLFKMPEGSLKLERVAAGLKKIGFDYVVSDEEARALAAAEAAVPLKAGLNAADGPVILTNSFAAKNFIARYFPELKAKTVVYPSEQCIFGQYGKGAFASSKKLEPARLRTAVVNNDNENGAEARETGCVDFSLNARELYRIFMRTGCNMKTLHDVELDALGAGADTPSALFDRVEWNLEKKPEVRTVELDGKSITAAIAHNLGQARALLEEMHTGKLSCQIIRIVA